MRILSTQQIKDLDAYTIRHEPISSIDLMERASRAFVDWFTTKIGVTSRVGIACGTGNNGGDGLAIARMLYEWGYTVKVWIIAGGASESGDFTINRERLPESVECVEVTEHEQVNFSGFDVLIDAIFGSGLSRPPAGLYADVIAKINNAEAIRVAVDIPSGLSADGPSSGAMVNAHYTITFQLPKLSFLLPESFPFTGEWKVVNIGLDKSFIKKAETQHFFTTSKVVRKILHSRSKFDHKGTYGHALLIAGSYGKLGAAVLAARAALRSGLGLLSVHVPQCGYQVLQTAVPEAMCQVDADEKILTHAMLTSDYSAVGIGPGLGQDRQTRDALSRTLQEYGKPVVIDADALNLIAADNTLMGQIPPGSILTPHPREFQRLVGTWADDFERLKMQRELAVSLKAVVVLKGAYTSVATGEGRVFFNSTGNPGMATGGSGDVLTGILTGLLAQKYSPVDAAILGVFLHGLAGDLVVASGSQEGLIASDLIDFLPVSFSKIAGK